MGSALLNMPFTDITNTITSYVFTDGSGLTLDNANNALGGFSIEISTDASGKIVAWFVGAFKFGADTQMQTNWDSPTGFIPGADFSETTANFAGDFGANFSNPGIWAASATTPEPSTLAFFAVGLLIIGIPWVRRTRLA
jgi:hypothetical protein